MTSFWNIATVECRSEGVMLREANVVSNCVAYSVQIEIVWIDVAKQNGRHSRPSVVQSEILLQNSLELVHILDLALTS